MLAGRHIRLTASILIGLIGLAAAGSIVFLTLVYPRQTIDYIEIHGLTDQAVLPAEAESYLESLRGLSYPDADERRITDYLERFGIIESCSVRKKYPGSLFITIVPKVPIAVFSSDVETVVNSDGTTFEGYEKLVSRLRNTIPFIELDQQPTGSEAVGEGIRDALRYIPMLNELKNAAADIYNLISEVKYGTNNSKAITIHITYIGFPLDLILYNPISGGRLEEAVRAALLIGKSESSGSLLQYKVFDTYMIESGE